MNEERRFIDDLSRKARLISLAIEYRPRRNVDVNRLNEITIHHRRLFLDHPYLATLAINMANNSEGGVNDIIQMQPVEVLPPISSLSLQAYRFEYASQGLHVNLNVRYLQRLTLDRCRRLDFLFYELRIRNAKLTELKLRQPIWREGAQSRGRQRFIFRSFLDQQVSLEVLELESIGFSRSVLHSLVHEGHLRALKALKLQDLDHELRTATSGITSGRAAEFKSLSHEDIHEFRLRCLELTTFHVDLAGWDFAPVSQCFGNYDIANHPQGSLAAQEISQCSQVRHLSITTQIHVNYQHLTINDVYKLACGVWSRNMQTLRMTVRLIHDDCEVGEEEWCVSREGGSLKVINETAARTERRLVSWSRALGWSVVRYDQPSAQKRHMEALKKSVERLGTAALADLGKESGAGRTKRSRRGHG
ncbi:MAG: hypothetical protein Q9163_002760 [Psora crenata]